MAEACFLRQCFLSVFGIADLVAQTLQKQARHRAVERMDFAHLDPQALNIAQRQQGALCPNI